jgi:hypothetical protein
MRVGGFRHVEAADQVDVDDRAKTLRRELRHATRCGRAERCYGRRDLLGRCD